MTLPQYTTPAKFTQFAAEDVTYGIDTSAVTATPTAVTAKLTLGTQPVTLTDPPSVSGAVISQRVRLGVLAAQPTVSDYTLTVTYTPQGTTNVLQAVVAIACPQ